MKNISRIYNVLFVSLWFCAALFCGGCGDREKCPSRLVYKLPFTLYPQKDTFKIGIDTIWIEANFNSTLVDTNGIANTFDDCDFKIELATSKIDTDPETGKTIENFPAIIKTGNLTPRTIASLGLSYYEVKTTYDKGMYRFKAGLIPKNKGLYGVSIAPIIYKQLQCPLTNNCKNTSYVVYSEINIGGKNNFYFLAKSPVPHISKGKEVDYLNGGGYAFYVK